jgi:HTH-type transcriptional regulator / antitoxin HipB
MTHASRTPTQLGAALRRYRKQLNVSQAELGGRISKRQATVSNLEADGSGTLETLFAVLSALELELVVQPRRKSDRRTLGDIF